MNELIQALALGVIQGLTEFLPVSSSGHIEIAEYLLGKNSLGKDSMLMTVVLHFATAISTVIVFRRELVDIWHGLFRTIFPDGALRQPVRNSENRRELRFCINILLSMIPAVLIGILFEDQIDALFDNQLLLVGAMLIVTGGLLLLADRAQVTDKQVGPVEAILIGLAQAVAILPGISRSGATISTSVLLGVDRGDAARFSFLMVVPLIFGKMGYDVLKMLLKSGPSETPEAGTPELLPLLVGFLAALITGWLACTWMIQLVRACQLKWFAWYCFAAAVAVIAMVIAFPPAFGQ